MKKIVSEMIIMYIEVSYWRCKRITGKKINNYINSDFLFLFCFLYSAGSHVPTVKLTYMNDCRGFISLLNHLTVFRGYSAY